MSVEFAEGSGPLVVAVAPGAAIDRLEEALWSTFSRIRDALGAGRSVVVVLSSRDLPGHGEPADAALAGAIVGMARSLALEGARDGWSVNVLCVEHDTPPEQRDRWVARLGEPSGLSGAVIRMGGGHLGRLPV